MNDIPQIESEDMLHEILCYISENEDVLEDLSVKFDLTPDEFLLWAEKIKFKAMASVSV